MLTGDGVLLQVLESTEAFVTFELFVQFVISLIV